jgi:hypothetical protein
MGDEVTVKGVIKGLSFAVPFDPTAGDIVS